MDTDDMQLREQEVPVPSFVDWVKAPLGPPKGLINSTGLSFAKPFSRAGGPSATEIADNLSKAGFRKPKT